jgi:DNA polymerase bacteriophage-type
MKGFLDLETYSEVPIKSGTFKYAEAAEILLFAYATDDEPVKVWDLTAQPLMPADLKRMLADPEVIISIHNCAFDRTILRHTIGIDLPIERCRCTMARALSHGLPGSLDTLSEIFNLPIDKAKSKEGYKLIRKFCMPQSTTSKIRRRTRVTDPDDWKKFIEYARLDIEAMRILDCKLPNWNYSGEELELWQLDQRINDRGCYVDTGLAAAAIRAVDRAQEKLKTRTGEITYGAVESTTQRDALLEHILNGYGVSLPDMTASTLERRINDPDLPEDVRELLAIRLQSSLSSTAKYKRLLQMVSSDNRLRGTIQFCGAARTLRDSGRGFQTQNLARQTMTQQDIEFGIDTLKADCADLFFDNPMELASNCVRSVLTAAPGRKFVIADLKNIEGRYAAWLAGEEWKLKAFAAFDAGTGPDLYKLSCAKSFRIAVEDVTKKQRDEIGKPLELSMQFGGGVGAFVTFALKAGVDLKALVADAWDAIPGDIKYEAGEFWDYSVKQKRTLTLEKDVFITCDSLKRLWRNAHPNITSMWDGMETAARNAIDSKDKTFTSRKISFVRNGSWLRMLKPNGFSLSYPSPRIDGKGKISFLGTDQYTRKFGWIETYGPKLFENGVQGGSRDIFKVGEKRADKNGYNVVLKAHDELVSEVLDKDRFTAATLCSYMTGKIEWATGLPLAASGFETYRYRKE